MEILLTDGCGFIGYAVIRHLIRHTGHVPGAAFAIGGASRARTWTW